LEIIGIGKKIVEVHQGEGPLLGCECIVKEADERIDQKDSKKGPDQGIAEQSANFNLRPKTSRRKSNS
jgi:hypothetical protein